MKLLELIAGSDEAYELDSLAVAMKCDTRTIRRDLDSIQQLLRSIQGLEIRRSREATATASVSRTLSAGKILTS